MADTVKAGYNIVAQRHVTTSTPLNDKSPSGTQLSETWKRPEDAAKWLNRVTGEQVIATCENCSNSTETKAGLGLSPIQFEHQEKIIKNLIELIEGRKPLTDANLRAASSSTLSVTRGIILSLRNDPDVNILVQRLSAEMALAKTVEEALTARRLLIAGMREPNVAQNKEALEVLGKTLKELDQDINQLRLELELRKAIADNTTQHIIQRAGETKIEDAESHSLERNDLMKSLNQTPTRR